MKVGATDKNGWKLTFLAKMGVEGSKTNLRHLSRAIARTRKPVKSKYHNHSITGIKEWR